ncbi:hypothetical protein BDV32DRAFT_133458 [Aspergillus pseudonomiae]|nr:hypothetical protein BDV32DRAFT_133458 [Aspergillus pseudonomiae]
MTRRWQRWVIVSCLHTVTMRQGELFPALSPTPTGSWYSRYHASDMLLGSREGFEKQVAQREVPSETWSAAGQSSAMSGG